MDLLVRTIHAVGPVLSQHQAIRVACGSKCGSYRAKLTALEKATAEILEKSPTLHTESEIWIFTDSESAVERLKAGPGAQTDSTADHVWLNINSLAKHRNITIQWIPGHRDIDGNEAADKAAKEASQLDQQDVALDFNTMRSTIKRHFRKKWREAVLAQEGIYSCLLYTSPSPRDLSTSRMPSSA